MGKDDWFFMFLIAFMIVSFTAGSFTLIVIDVLRSPDEQCVEVPNA